MISGPASTGFSFIVIGALSAARIVDSSLTASLLIAVPWIAIGLAILARPKIGGWFGLGLALVSAGAAWWVEFLAPDAARSAVFAMLGGWLSGWFFGFAFGGASIWGVVISARLLWRLYALRT